MIWARSRALASLVAIVSMCCEPVADGRPLSHWLQLMRDGSIEERSDAVSAIARIGEPAVPHLLRAMEQYPETVDDVLTTLGSMGPVAHQSVPRLIQLLSIEVPDHRVSAASALLQVDCQRIDESLPVLISSLDPGRRSARLAVTSVGFLGAAGAPAVPALIRLLEAPEETLRIGAVTALSRIGPPARSAIPALRKAEIASPDITPSIRSAIETIEGTGMSPWPTCAARRSMGAEMAKRGNLPHE